MTIPQEHEIPEDTRDDDQRQQAAEALDLPPVDNAPPVKRGRGRPPKNPGAASPNKETPTGSAPRRGRPPKSDKKVYSIDEIKLMGKQLTGLHIMVAQIGGLPELAISEQEGELLAQSIINVADQYDLAIDGKTGAALQLAMTAAMIYGPRALHIRARVAAQKQQQAAPESNG